MQRIGILVVHGIGEQKRGEYLGSFVGNLKAALDKEPWREPQQVDVAGSAQEAVLLTWKKDTAGTPIEALCREVYWADLDTEMTVWRWLRLVIWALGMPGTRLFNQDKPGFCTPVPLTDWQRLRVRAELFGVSLVFLILLGTVDVLYGVIQFVSARESWLRWLTWLPLDWIKGKLRGIRALFYNYLGDIKLYQDQTRRDSATGELPRVAIQKRMVEGLKRMAVDPGIEHYLVVGHSLGSVVAYNGLMECDNRDELLAKCQGFLSLGSPLNKFAAIWPGIVPINSTAPTNPIPWVNVADVQDIVAGKTHLFQPCQNTSSIGGLIDGLAGGKRDFEWGDQRVLVTAHMSYWAARPEGKPRLIDRLIPWLEGGALIPPEHNLSPILGKVIYVASLVGGGAVLMWIFSTLAWVFWRLFSPGWLPVLQGGYIAEVCFVAKFFLVLGVLIILAASGILWGYQTYQERRGLR